MPTDAALYARLLQRYQELAAGVRAIREAVEQTFGARLPRGTPMNEQLQAITRAIYAAAERPRTASTPVTDETRTHFQYRIDLWDDAGDNIVEQVASLEDFAVAQAAYDRACRRWPKTVITLRRGTQVVETTRRGHL